MARGEKREKKIVWQDPTVNRRDVAHTTGLDYLKAIQAGRAAPPPIAMLLGYEIVSVEHGHTVYRLQAQECHQNPFATVHGGVISTLLDTTMAAAILSTLPVGVSLTTVEIKVNFIRAVSGADQWIQCEAKPIHLGRRLATAQGWLNDSRGKLCAHGVCTCSLFNHASDNRRS